MNARSYFPFFTALLFASTGNAQTNTPVAAVQFTKDSVSIIRLLEKESATWRSGDVAGHASCWVIRPYSRILISTGDGRVIDLPPQMMVTPPEGSMGKGGSSVNSDYKMDIRDNTAWVSHQEESTTKEGKKSRTFEIRMLEKMEGGWKLVGQSIHVMAAGSDR